MPVLIVANNKKGRTGARPFAQNDFTLCVAAQPESLYTFRTRGTCSAGASFRHIPRKRPMLVYRVSGGTGDGFAAIWKFFSLVQHP